MFSIKAIKKVTIMELLMKRKLHLRSAGTAIDLQRYQQAVQVDFVDANSNSIITGEELNFSNINFAKGGRNPSYGVRSYSKVKVENLYKGIDLVIYANDIGIKYDLLVDQGVNPSIVQMKYDGHNSLRIQDEKLAVNTIFGTFYENSPLAFHIEEGSEKKCGSTLRSD